MSAGSAQFYLPLQYSGAKKQAGQTSSPFDQIFNFDFEDSVTIDTKQDKTYQTFDFIKKQYKQQQVQFGTVSADLRAKKNNFTDQIIENISTQIVKLAHYHKAFVVFERLETGFAGSKKLELTTYTEILAQTYQKLCKTGLALSTDVKYMVNKIDLGIARVSPYMTSQTCSDCGYVPRYYTTSKYKSDEENQQIKNERVWIDESQWPEQGILEFSFAVEGEIFASILDKGGYLECRTKRSGAFEIDNSLEKYDYRTKVNTGSQVMAMIQKLSEVLITSRTKARSQIKDAHRSIFRSTILKPRLNQDLYSCPCCGMQMNADYNASKNIAKQFIKGLRG